MKLVSDTKTHISIYEKVIKQLFDLLGMLLNFLSGLISLIISIIQQLLGLLFGLIDFIITLLNQLMAFLQAILNFLKLTCSYLMNVIENASIILATFAIITVGALVYNRIR